MGKRPRSGSAPSEEFTADFTRDEGECSASDTEGKFARLYLDVNAPWSKKLEHLPLLQMILLGVNRFVKFPQPHRLPGQKLIRPANQLTPLRVGQNSVQ